MENKRAKVVMLPTRDKSVLSKAYLANPSYLRYDIKGYEYDSFKNNDNQHLYITVDEEIKKGDWFLDETLKPKNSLDDLEYELIGKIVATTDTSLLITRGQFNEQKEYLPQPSQAFIKKYCELGGIDEVLVEYNSKLDIGYYSNCNGGSERSFQCTCNNGFRIFGSKLTLKIDPVHNTIIIHPIKNSWNREEVIDLIKLYQEDFCKFKSIELGLNELKSRIDLPKYWDNWIKKNL